eukprot:3569079-Amphidinium_carterae.1
MRKLRLAFETLAKRHLQVVRDAPSLAACEFREKMLSLFSPSRPRRRAFVRSVAETVLNGDWRRLDCIEHVCAHDCCPSFEVSVQRVADALGSVFVAVRPNIFNKGNWRTWSRNLSMFGLGGAIHGVLAAAYAIAFENASADDVMLQRQEHLALDLGAADE